MGYQKYTAEQKIEAVAEFARSGMSIRAFAAGKGLSVSTFFGWVKKLRDAGGIGPQAPKAAFIELKPAADAGRPEAGRAVTVDFMGARISMPASALPALIEALRGKA